MARADRQRRTPWIFVGLAGAGALVWWLSSSGERSGKQQAQSGSEPYRPPTEDEDMAELRGEDIPGSVAAWIPLAVTLAHVNAPKRFQMTTTDFARLILAHIAVESAGNEMALGDQGRSYGLMQINTQWHPEYAALSEAMRYDPLTNVEYGSRLLASLLDYYSDTQGGDPMIAIRAGVSAYNAGQSNVNRALRQGRDPASVTYLGEYADKVLDRFYNYGGYQVFIG